MMKIGNINIDTIGDTEIQNQLIHLVEKAKKGNMLGYSFKNVSTLQNYMYQHHQGANLIKGLNDYTISYQAKTAIKLSALSMAAAILMGFSYPVRMLALLPGTLMVIAKAASHYGDFSRESQQLVFIGYFYAQLFTFLYVFAISGIAALSSLNLV